MSIEEAIRQNLRSVQYRIEAAAERAGRDYKEITLVAVTKSVGLDEVRVLRNLGVTHFGESRVDVARSKIDGLADPDVIWHMIGNIQRRKAGEVLRLFQRIDTVDRLSLADALQKRCEQGDMRCQVLVEVNVSGETQKHGFAPASFEAAMGHLTSLERMHIDGLLTMAPHTTDREKLDAVFHGLAALAGRYDLPIKSMGMSGDFEAAIEAGATEIRLGRILFD